MLVYMELLEGRWDMADNQKFMQKAREYIDSQLRLDPMQWEYDGIVPLKNADNLMDFVEILHHENPNARIQAARVLRLYEGNAITYLLERLIDRLSDRATNRISSSFQCEEEELVCVADEIKETIDALKGV